MGNRRKAREYTLQLLYQFELTQDKLAKAVDRFLEENTSNEEVAEFTHQLTEGVLKNFQEIDQFIEGCSTNWKLSRMASVDRNILRLATFEILYLTDIPSSVSINEAVEIAKKFGTEDSAGFINGILDKIAKEKNEQS